MSSSAQKQIHHNTSSFGREPSCRLPSSPSQRPSIPKSFGFKSKNPSVRSNVVVKLEFGSQIKRTESTPKLLSKRDHKSIEPPLDSTQYSRVSSTSNLRANVTISTRPGTLTSLSRSRMSAFQSPQSLTTIPTRNSKYTALKCLDEARGAVKSLNHIEPHQGFSRNEMTKVQDIFLRDQDDDFVDLLRDGQSSITPKTTHGKIILPSTVFGGDETAKIERRSSIERRSIVIQDYEDSSVIVKQEKTVSRPTRGSNRRSEYLSGIEQLVKCRKRPENAGGRSCRCQGCGRGGIKKCEVQTRLMSFKSDRRDPPTGKSEMIDLEKDMKKRKEDENEVSTIKITESTPTSQSDSVQGQAFNEYFQEGQEQVVAETITNFVGNPPSIIDDKLRSHEKENEPVKETEEDMELLKEKGRSLRRLKTEPHSFLKIAEVQEEETTTRDIIRQPASEKKQGGREIRISSRKNSRAVDKENNVEEKSQEARGQKVKEWLKLTRVEKSEEKIENWKGNVKVLEEILRRNKLIEGIKDKRDLSLESQVFKQGANAFFEWNTDNKAVQEYNLAEALKENLLTHGRKNFRTKTQTECEERSTVKEALKTTMDEHQSKTLPTEVSVRVVKTDKKPKIDPSTMIVRYYDELNPLAIQPKYMEASGSMCVTELWGNKNKHDFYKVMRKPLKTNTILSLSPQPGIYRPERTFDSETLKRKRQANGALDFKSSEEKTTEVSPFPENRTSMMSKKARHTRAFVLQGSGTRPKTGHNNSTKALL